MSLPAYHSAVKAGEALPSSQSVELLEMGRRWYAACTLPRHEKSIAERLYRQGIETYLPLYSAIHCWGHRKVTVHLPLFPGYIFIKIHIADRSRILAHPGIVRFVSFNGHAAAISDDEVERLRSSLARFKAQPYPFLSPGKQIQICSGPLAGLKGKIIRRKGKMRLVMSLDLLQRAILFEVDIAEAQLAS
jgi:transcription antitermination factor NusG